MIATTIMISTNVNPRRPCLMVCILYGNPFAAVNRAEGVYSNRTLMFTNCPPQAVNSALVWSAGE